jgi:thiosulfate/3-mercaptopyruvate sulfurtransferase
MIVRTLSDLLVSPEWLVRHHADPNLRVLDPRRPEDFAKGHVPGALNAWSGFKDEANKLHVMPAEQAQKEIRALGVSDGTTVVVLGDGMLSGRVWWVLRLHGLRDARIADGGHAAYVAAGGPMSIETATVPPGDFTARRDASLISGPDDIARSLGSEKILDVRGPEEWRGENRFEHKRVGHIPGAVHVIWDELLTAEKKFRTPDEIRALVAKQGITPADPVVTVCEVGYRAAHTAFALRLAGFNDVRVYDASMREWDNREDLPLEPPSAASG